MSVRFFGSGKSHITSTCFSSGLIVPFPSWNLANSAFLVANWNFYCAEKVGDIGPSLLHVIQPDEQVINHFDVPVDVASYLVIAVYVCVTAGQLSLRPHLVSVAAPWSDEHEIMVIVRVNRYTVESIPGVHGGHQPASWYFVGQVEGCATDIGLP